MANLETIKLNPVQLSIEPKTRMLVVKQGSNEVRFVREDITCLKSLREGSYEDGVYTSQITPRNRCVVAENGTITVTCKDDWSDNIVVIANHKKLDDLQRIQQFVDKNKTRIARKREFKGRY